MHKVQSPKLCNINYMDYRMLNWKGHAQKLWPTARYYLTSSWNNEKKHNISKSQEEISRLRSELQPLNTKQCASVCHTSYICKTTEEQDKYVVCTRICCYWSQDQ